MRRRSMSTLRIWTSTFSPTEQVAGQVLRETAGQVRSRRRLIIERSQLSTWVVARGGRVNVGVGHGHEANTKGRQEDVGGLDVREVERGDESCYSLGRHERGRADGLPKKIH